METHDIREIVIGNSLPVFHIKQSPHTRTQAPTPAPAPARAHTAGELVLPTASSSVGSAHSGGGGEPQLCMLDPHVTLRWEGEGGGK